MNRSINLVNFAQLFESKQAEDTTHPEFKERKAKGWPPMVVTTHLNLKTVNEMYPFATVFSTRGIWSTQREILEKELPKEFKVIFESKKAVNNTHKESGACQWIVVVDKV